MGSIVLWQTKTPSASYWEWQDWFPAQCFSKTCNPLLYSWKLCPWHWGIPSGIPLSLERREYNIIWYFSKAYFTKKKKSQVQMHRVFLFPLLLLCTSYSLRSWDSLITAVAIITHLCFCRALLRSWESFINTSSLVVPAAWQVEGSHCLKRMRLWSSPDWCCRRSGARGLGRLEPFAGTAICQRHQSLKAAWSLALGHLTILEFHNKNLQAPFTGQD